MLNQPCELRECSSVCEDAKAPSRCPWHRFVYGTAPLDAHVFGLIAGEGCVYGCGEKYPPKTSVCFMARTAHRGRRIGR